jgi:hypothetical protein
LAHQYYASQPEISVLLEAAGKTVADLTVMEDGELVVSTALVDDARTLFEQAEGRSDTAVEDDGVIDVAATEVLDDEDSADAADNRELADFDAIVAGLDLVALDGSLAELGLARLPFARARQARRQEVLHRRPHAARPACIADLTQELGRRLYRRTGTTMGDPCTQSFPWPCSPSRRRRSSCPSSSCPGAGSTPRHPPSRPHSLRRPSRSPAASATG